MAIWVPKSGPWIFWSKIQIPKVIQIPNRKKIHSVHPGFSKKYLILLRDPIPIPVLGIRIMICKKTPNSPFPFFVIRPTSSRLHSAVEILGVSRRPSRHFGQRFLSAVFNQLITAAAHEVDLSMAAFSLSLSVRPSIFGSFHISCPQNFQLL